MKNSKMNFIYISKDLRSKPRLKLIVYTYLDYFSNLTPYDIFLTKVSIPFLLEVGMKILHNSEVIRKSMVWTIYDFMNIKYFVYFLLLKCQLAIIFSIAFKNVSCRIRIDFLQVLQTSWLHRIFASYGSLLTCIIQIFPLMQHKI